MDVSISPLEEKDLPEADRIFRLAFGTFLGLPDPMAFGGDADFIGTRWRADPGAALGAYSDGRLVGSNFAANWGSFGFFGPLTIRPDSWDKGIARRLLDETMRIFDRWQTQRAALFTFAHSPKHVALYQKYGFWPLCLTPIMSKTAAAPATPASDGWSLYRAGDEGAAARCAELTDAVLPGLDLRGEIRSVAAQAIGETVLVHDADARLAGLAVCHMGKGSEAGSGSTYVKFGAVRPGDGAPGRFDRLLSAIEAVAHARGAANIVAGSNTARVQAYQQMLDRGYRTQFLGVAMLRSDDPGYNRPDAFVIDDWR